MKRKFEMSAVRCVFFVCATALFLCLQSVSSRAQLVINEFSQGPSGTKEYVELVVTGTRTCTDSCADLRGWLIDDNNGWCGTGGSQGIAPGCMRFANTATWACVPYGSIILIYNSNDKNTAITQADDATDANNDHVYIVPSASALLESNTTSPVSPSSASFVYPTTGFSGTGSWATVGLRNDGDAVIVTKPTLLSAAHHSISYGDVSSGTATVHLSPSGGGRVYYLSNSQYANAAAWVSGNAPANETPGQPNGGANTTWINTLLAPVAGGGDTNLHACILQGQTYAFNGQNLGTAGVYHDTVAVPGGCDSFVHLHLQVITPQVKRDSIKACNQIVHNGITYTTTTILYDTVNSVLGCDSIFHELHLIVRPLVPVQATQLLSGCGSLVFKGNTYTGSATVLDTLQSVQGCDSVYRHTHIVIYPVVTSSLKDTVTGCQAVLYRNRVYTASTLVKDTLRTLQGCDSVYRDAYVRVLDKPTLSVTPANPEACPGQPLTLTAFSNGTVQWVGFGPGASITVTPNAATTYKVVAINSYGCTDTLKVPVSLQDFRLELSLQGSPDVIEKGDRIVLQSGANRAYQVLEWWPGGLFSNPHATSQQVIAEATTEYAVVGVSNTGCPDTAFLLVTVLPPSDIFMPSAFSPNNDGRNDTYHPVFSGPYKIVEFNIYNRWGQLVYTARNSSMGKGWDGRLSGTECGIGTYYYTLMAESPKGKPIQKKGDFILIR